MVDNVKEFLDREYLDCVRIVERKKENPKDLWWVDKKMCDSAIQRGLGVVQFVQTIGVPFEEIDSVYEEYRAKLEKLREVVE